MKWQVVLAAVAASALMLSSATAREGDPRLDCLDSADRDHCAADIRAAMLAEFDAEPAEALAARGVEGLRLYMIGGMPETLPLISVLTEPGGAATLSVSAPIDEVFDEPRKMTIAADQKTLDLGRSLAEDAAAAPVTYVPTEAQDDIWCMRSWLVVIESIEAGKVERRVRKHCAEEPLFATALELSTAAQANFPQCRGITSGMYEEMGFGGPAGLRRCSVLEGDPAAGIEVLSNMIYLTLRGDETPGRLTPGVELAWAGQPTVRGPKPVIDALEKRAGGLGPLHAEYAVVATAETVQVTGVVSNINGPDGKMDMACRWVSASEQTWVKGADGAWRLSRWTIGPARRAPYPGPGANPSCNGPGPPTRIVATMEPLKVFDGLPEGCRKAGEALVRMNVCFAKAGAGMSDADMTRRLTSMRADLDKEPDLAATCSGLAEMFAGTPDAANEDCG